MPKHVPASGRPWQATLIITLFFIAVAGAAAIGWWYAREAPPHQGPLVLIAVDDLDPAALEGVHPDTPALGALVADSVIFDRAYAHSPLLLPAEASILSGELPYNNGLRDDAGFALKPAVRTMADLLRGRGFETGAAVSSYLLRRDSGLAQGFSFFDEQFRAPGEDGPVAGR
jgi:arylsulfatase A-like enzyme